MDNFGIKEKLLSAAHSEFIKIFLVYMKGVYAYHSDLNFTADFCEYRQYLELL